MCFRCFRVLSWATRVSPDRARCLSFSHSPIFVCISIRITRGGFASPDTVHTAFGNPTHTYMRGFLLPLLTVRLLGR